MTWRMNAALASSLALCCGLAEAQTSRPTSRPANDREARRAERRAAQRARKLVTPEASRANSGKLIDEINWHRSLAEAKTEARRQKKLVFWMHSVGDLTGKL